MLELTNTEQTIMKCIWELGNNVSVADLLEHLKSRYGKSYARTTISVFMSYLRDKGYVAYEKRSHAFIYHPLVSEQEYQKEMIKRYQQNSMYNSNIEFIKAFLNENHMTKEECRQIRAILDKKEEELSSAY